MMRELLVALFATGSLLGDPGRQPTITLPGGGMYPCYPKNSRVAIEYEPYASPDEVRRGEVVLFRSELSGKPSDVVWRVIGLPSEHIVVDDTKVWVDNEALNSAADGGTAEWSHFLESSEDLRYCVAYHRERPEYRKRFEVAVPPGHFLVLGDNRDHSYDSRYVGTVPFDAILARFKNSSCACPSAHTASQAPAS